MAIVLIAKRRFTKNSIRWTGRRSCFSRRAMIRAFHIEDLPSFALTRHYDHPFPYTRRASSSASSYSIPVTKANDVPPTTSFSFLFFISLSFSSPNFFPHGREDARSIRIARSRKPAAIDVYRVTRLRKITHIMWMQNRSLFLFTLPGSSIFLGFCEISTWIKTPVEWEKCEWGWYMSTYYLHLSRDGIKTEFLWYTTPSIYIFENPIERIRVLFFRRTNAMT